MRILLYSWDANNEFILISNLKVLGHEVIKYTHPCVHFTRDTALIEDLIPIIYEVKADAVLSLNYFPILSTICHTVKIPYYSWVYDSPHLTLYAREVSLPCNHIGLFDKHQVEKFNAQGINTVFHLPLAVDTAYWSQRIAADNSQDYYNDISFVGSLYKDSSNYFESISSTAELKHETLKYISDRIFNYSDAPNAPDELILAWLNPMAKAGLLLGEDYDITGRELVMSQIIDRETTSLERILLLEEINTLFPGQLDLYTSTCIDSVPELANCHHGTVNYYFEMPLIFNRSKINLNITLRSIKSGIPLRVLDIMGSGGFTLSNYQPEIEEFFDIDKEIVVFNSPEECTEKADYYLHHDKQRTAIAQSGATAVKERFTYEAALKKLLNT